MKGKSNFLRLFFFFIIFFLIYGGLFYLLTFLIIIKAIVFFPFLFFCAPLSILLLTEIWKPFFGKNIQFIEAVLSSWLGLFIILIASSIIFSIVDFLTGLGKAGFYSNYGSLFINSILFDNPVFHSAILNIALFYYIPYLVLLTLSGFFIFIFKKDMLKDRFDFFLTSFLSSTIVWIVFGFAIIFFGLI